MEFQTLKPTQQKQLSISFAYSKKSPYIRSIKTQTPTQNAIQIEQYTNQTTHQNTNTIFQGLRNPFLRHWSGFSFWNKQTHYQQRKTPTLAKYGGRLEHLRQYKHISIFAPD